MIPKSLSELFGYVSMCCWLGAQFPQILENMKRQSCESLALPFLFNWMLGDASNLIGCILTHQLPFQTYLATYFCLIDCCLLFQYFYYGGAPKASFVIHPHTRSRTTSSARRLSVDASHYRTLSTTKGTIVTAAALAAHLDTHPEHRRPQKHGDISVDTSSATQHPSEEPQDEVSDAVLSALSESFYSESGRGKRVSWSQERQEPPLGGSSRLHMSPVIPTRRHTSATAPTAALLARGRPPRREEEAEAEELPREQTIETERRNTSRASRRSAGMVLLGMSMLFGFGRFTSGMQPLVGRGVKTGAVLSPTTSNLDLSLPIAPVTHQHTDPPPFSLDVELPSLPDDTNFGEQQADSGVSYERIVGRIFAWLCTTLYLTSRLPQIWKNYVRKSVEGLTILLFISAFLGNFFYVLSIVTSPNAQLPPPASTKFLRESLPYLLGSGGTFVFDITIVSQFFIYKGRHPRRSYIRSRGNSLVRSAALAEETAGLLRGDVLPAARAHSQWARADNATVARSQSRS